MYYQDDDGKGGTSCIDCIFAEWAGSAQVGCKIGRLKKFEDAGNVTMENLGEKVCANINRFCMTYRPQQWADKQKQSDLRKAVMEEIAVKVDFIIPLRAGDCLDKLCTTLDSLNRQTVLPKTVMVVNLQKSIKPFSIVKLLNSDYSLSYRVHDIQHKDETLSDEKISDAVFEFLDAAYYSLLPCGFILPDNFLANLDYAMNEQLRRFSVLLSDAYPISVVSRVFHQHSLVQGNTPQRMVHQDTGETIELPNLIAKAKWLAEDEPHMIARIEDICELRR